MTYCSLEDVIVRHALGMVCSKHRVLHGTFHSPDRRLPSDSGHGLGAKPRGRDERHQMTRLDAVSCLSISFGATPFLALETIGSDGSLDNSPRFDSYPTSVSATDPLELSQFSLAGSK